MNWRVVSALLNIWILFFGIQSCNEYEIGTLSDDTKLQIRKSLKAEGFYGVVLISQDQDILYRDSLIPDSKNNPKQLYKKHSYPIGETSKLFTATAIHILKSESKIKLDDKVKSYLKWYPDPKTKISDLLRHTSGLPKLLEIISDFEEKKPTISKSQVLNAFRDSKKNPSFSAGEYWKFSRLDYVLLGEVISVVSKQTYADFIKEKIFVPLDMKLSSIDDKDPLLGNSGVLSSPEDLQKFAFAFQKATILNKADRDSIVKKTILSDQVSEDPIAFGEGVYVGDYFYWGYGKEKNIANFYYHDLNSRIFITIVNPFGGTKGDLSSIKSSITEIIFNAKKLSFTKTKKEDDQSIYIEDLMALEKVPSLGIAVYRNYALSWKKNYGTKSNQTLFRAGSLSKTVTATATLRLVEEGKLNLYSNWTPKLKKYKVELPHNKKKPNINLDLLLSHTSGLTEKGNWDDPINRNKRKLKDIQDINSQNKSNGLKLYYKPGTKSRYSGGGYSIVQEILTEITKLNFPTLIDQTVFRPLGLKRSTFQQNLDESADRLEGFDTFGNPLPQKVFVTPELSSGGLWTTPEEIGNLFIEVAKARQGKSNFLTEESARYLLEPKMSAANLTVHALVAHGFFLNRTGRTEYFFHGGHTTGHKSLALFNAERGYGIVIMTNSENGSKLIWRILRTVSVREKWDKFVN